MEINALLRATARVITPTLIGAAALLANAGPAAATTPTHIQPAQVGAASYATADGVAPGCKPGYVWRNVRDGDGVCVTPEERQYVYLENINRDSYIPGTVNSCRPGYVWRDAWNGDGVCVVPSDRARAHQQNAESPLHSIG